MLSAASICKVLQENVVFGILLLLDTTAQLVHLESFPDHFYEFHVGFATSLETKIANGVLPH